MQDQTASYRVLRDLRATPVRREQILIEGKEGKHNVYLLEDHARAG